MYADLHLRAILREHNQQHLPEQSESLVLGYECAFPGTRGSSTDAWLWQSLDETMMC